MLKKLWDKLSGKERFDEIADRLDKVKKGFKEIEDEFKKFRKIDGMCNTVEDRSIGDEVPVAGGVGFPEYLLRNDTVHFSNYPKDDKSRHLLQIIGLHLWRFDDEDKDKVIDFLFRLITDKDSKSKI